MAVPTRMNLFVILYIYMLLLVVGLQNGHSSSCLQLKLLFLADVSEPSGSSRKKIMVQFQLRSQELSRDHLNDTTHSIFFWRVGGGDTKLFLPTEIYSPPQVKMTTI
jgi:hypothetical protein